MNRGTGWRTEDTETLETKVEEGKGVGEKGDDGKKGPVKRGGKESDGGFFSSSGGFKNRLSRHWFNFNQATFCFFVPIFRFNFSCVWHMPAAT
jgi:hypothetical protein